MNDVIHDILIEKRQFVKTFFDRFFKNEVAYANFLENHLIFFFFSLK